jgi:aminopeptidase S
MRLVLDVLTTSALALVLASAACVDLDPAQTGQTDQDELSPGSPLPHIGFSVAASPSTQSVVGGDVVDFTLVATASGLGPCISISYSVAGVPFGAKLTYTDSTQNTVSLCAGGTASTHVVVTLAPNTAPGTDAITFTATGGGLIRTAIETLVVRPASFTVNVWPPAANLVAGGTATVSLDLVLDGSLASTLATTPIVLSASGLPAGVTVAFSPAKLIIASNPKSTVTFTAGAATFTPTRVGLVATNASDGTQKIVAIDLGPGTQLVTNGDFETSPGSPWSVVGGMILQPWSEAPHLQIDEAHDGIADAFGVGNGTVSQTITIPANSAHVMLAFWMHGTTSSMSRVTVELTLVPTFQRFTLATYHPVDLDPTLEPSAKYARYDLDLNPYRGQTANVLFRISTDAGGQNGVVYIDDVSVAASY